MPEDIHPFLLRLQQATNDHDLDALVDCFTPDYCNEAPAHPRRAFKGSEQVRTNWRQIFGFVPDVQSRVLGYAVNGSEVWSEWEMSGTRVDGTQHLMRGVIVFGLQNGRASSARFYLEPVEESATTVDDAVRVQVHADTPT
ncbi:MAG: nuclear transport factor 2 family protein [Actinomycetota bacterium]|nr:nuclear transport factor 2 family protein [Actinomycetota bacterium]